MAPSLVGGMIPQRRRKRLLCHLLLLVFAMYIFSSLFMLYTDVSMSRKYQSRASTSSVPSEKGESSGVVTTSDFMTHTTGNEVLETKAEKLFVLQVQETALKQVEQSGLRAVASNIFHQSGHPVEQLVSGFLTRVYNSASPEGSSQLEGPLQLMPYYSQSSKRKDAHIVYYDGIIDLDQEGFKEAVDKHLFSEMLLLVFSDWDDAADKYITLLQRVAETVDPYTTVTEESMHTQLKEKLEGLKGEFKPNVVTARPSAFTSLFAGERVRSKGRNHLFSWPTPDSKGPVHIIAAIRKSDFGEYNFFGDDTLKMTLHSPSLFFYSGGKKNVRRYDGPLTEKGLIDFIRTHTLSRLQLLNKDELDTVLDKYDRLLLIVCKDSGYNRQHITSLMHDALLVNEGLHLKFRGRVPTFFIQEEMLEGAHLINWGALDITGTRDLKPEDLKFLADDPQTDVGANFIDQLRLSPLSDKARILLLDRVVPKEGRKKSSLEHFTASVLRFPAPGSETDLSMWAKTFGARLVDIVEDMMAEGGNLVAVSGSNIQEVYERHFRIPYTTLKRRLRQRQLLEAAHGATQTSLKARSDSRFFVLVVLGPSGSSKAIGCEKAVRQAVRKSGRDSGVQFASATVEDAKELLEELRFTIWRNFHEDSSVANCEVYVFNSDGDVQGVDIGYNELRKPGKEWGKLFFKVNGVPAQDKKQCLPAPRAPSPDVLRRALQELKNTMVGATATDANTTYRTPLGTAEHDIAPSHLWVPQGEHSPLVVYNQRVKVSHCDAARERRTFLLLVHDSSCAATANHYKALRLLGNCQKNGVIPSTLKILEYDVSEHYNSVFSVEKFIQPVTVNVDVSTRTLLYERLRPLLQDVASLLPPQLFAVNGTHILCTLNTAKYYSHRLVSKQKDLSNGFVRTVAQMLNYVASDIGVNEVASCMLKSIEDERAARQGYRRLSARG